MFRIEFLQLSLNLVLLKFKKHELSCGFVNITGVRGPRKVECLVTSHIKISMELFPAEPPRTISTDEQMVDRTLLTTRLLGEVWVSQTARVSSRVTPIGGLIFPENDPETKSLKL